MNNHAGVVLNPNGAFASSGSNREDEEVKLAKRIGLLWGSHGMRDLTIKMSREELNQIRADLSTELYACKKLLGETGREGRWALLKEVEILLSAANGCVCAARLNWPVLRESSSLRSLRHPRSYAEDIERRDRACRIVGITS